MVNAGEVNNRLEAYMLQQDERLKRIEDSVATLMASVTTIAAKVDVLTERVDKGYEDARRNFENPPPCPNDMRILQQQGPNFHVPDPRLTAVDRGAKLDVGDFNGDQGPESFFDWIHSLESFFRWYELSDERKLFFADAKLKGTARIWWDHHQRNLYTAARRWEDMKAAMTRRFVPPDYKQRACLQLTELVQGSKSVAEYTSSFYSLVTRSEFPWVEDVLISMYRRGLNHEIASGVASGKILLLDDAVQVANQVEDTLKRNVVRPPIPVQTRSERTFVEPFKSRSVEKSTNSSTASRPNRTTSSSNASNNPSVRCFNCRGFGHMTFECPSPKMSAVSPPPRQLVVHKDCEKTGIHEEICPPSDEECEPTEQDLEADAHLEGCLGVLRPLMVAQKQKDDPQIHRGRIFQTRVRCAGQLCSLVIDTGSCTDVISEEAVQKLRLKVEPHPDPYDVAWVTNTKLRVTQRCSVTFSVGKLQDTVMCDILPLKVCHIILGRTWLWDRHARHDARANTYSILKGNTKFTLTCALNMPKLKLTKNSLVILRTCAYVSNSTESSFSQQRRTDVGRKRESWLDQYKRLWKPN